MNYPLYIFLGLLPSFIWLILFLRMDKDPESKQMILKIFLFGMLSVLPIIIFVVFSQIFFPFIPLGFEEVVILPIFILIFFILFWATIEEILKYLVVKYKVLSHSEFDEPVDVMIYMITAGLGFAALENILILFGHPFLPLPELLGLAFIRFISATILHALCSGLFGYFLALSLFHFKNRKKFLFYGIFFSALLHGLYNFFIIKIETPVNFIFVGVVLIVLATFVILGIKKLKKIKSVCLSQPI